MSDNSKIVTENPFQIFPKQPTLEFYLPEIESQKSESDDEESLRRDCDLSEFECNNETIDSKVKIITMGDSQDCMTPPEIPQTQCIMKINRPKTALKVKTCSSNETSKSWNQGEFLSIPDNPSGTPMKSIPISSIHSRKRETNVKVKFCPTKDDIMKAPTILSRPGSSKPTKKLLLDRRASLPVIFLPSDPILGTIKTHCANINTLKRSVSFEESEKEIRDVVPSKKFKLSCNSFKSCHQEPSHHSPEQHQNMAVESNDGLSQAVFKRVGKLKQEAGFLNKLRRFSEELIRPIITTGCYRSNSIASTCNVSQSNDYYSRNDVTNNGDYSDDTYHDSDSSVRKTPPAICCRLDKRFGHLMESHRIAKCFTVSAIIVIICLCIVILVKSVENSV